MKIDKGFILYCWIIIFWSVACTDDLGDDESDQRCFPQNEQTLMTRSSVVDFETNWENLSDVVLPNGQLFYLPWGDNSEISAHSDTYGDVKKTMVGF